MDSLLEDVVCCLIFSSADDIYSTVVDCLRDHCESPPRVCLTEQPNFDPTPDHYEIFWIHVKGDSLRLCYRGEERLV
jgi:hypothetical protein